MTTKNKISKSKNLVLYVENSILKAKAFSSSKKANSFVTAFLKKHKDPMTGYWIDMMITDIQGEVKLFDLLEVTNEA